MRTRPLSLLPPCESGCWVPGPLRLLPALPSMSPLVHMVSPSAARGRLDLKGAVCPPDLCQAARRGVFICTAPLSGALPLAPSWLGTPTQGGAEQAWQSRMGVESDVCVQVCACVCGCVRMCTGLLSSAPRALGRRPSPAQVPPDSPLAENPLPAHRSWCPPLPPGESGQ